MSRFTAASDFDYSEAMGNPVSSLARSARLSRTHTHACQSCQADTECAGGLELNPDGFPDVICREFHLDGGTINGDFLCETCHAKAEADQQVEA